MCDCYVKKCEKCTNLIPVHIADFKYLRTNLRVFCSKHIPKRKVTVFENLEDENFFEEEWDKRGWRCAFRLCNGTIEPSAKRVEPNVSVKQKITIVS
jgi:hypothetical protein